MKLIIALLSFLYSSCFTSKDKGDTLFDVKIINISSLSEAVLLTCSHNGDTIKVVSFVNDLYVDTSIVNSIDIGKADTITAGKVYQLDLFKPSQFRIDHISGLYSIVLDRDTIWKGFSTEGVPFYSKNSRGLYVERKTPISGK